ncbi:MAG: ABC transporter ATP-binding protein [Nitriliruptoraceae bacterium]
MVDPQPPSGRRRATIDEILRPGEAQQRDLRRLPTLIRQAFQLVWQAARRGLLLAAGLQLLAALSLAGQLLVMRRLLDAVGDDTDQLPDLITILPELVAFGVLLLVVAVATLAQAEQQRTLGLQVQKFTTAQVIEVATHVDLIDFDRPGFYDRLQRATVNAGVRPMQIASGVIGFIGSTTAVVAVGAALVVIEPIVAVLILLGLGPTLYLNRLSTRALHAHTVRQTPNDRRRAYLYSVLTRKEEAQEVRAFDSGSYLRGKHDELFDAKLTDLRATVRRRLRYGTIGAAIAAVITIGTLLLLVAFVRGGRLSVSDAVVAVGAVVIVSGRVRALSASTSALYEGALFLSDFTDFVAVEQARAGAQRPWPRPPAPFERLELEEVAFTYPSRTEPSLVDVSLTLSRGEVIALVGENGSGKTTLTKLLAGLYRPSQGMVRWDGEDLSGHDLAPLREHTTIIFQDFARYFLTAEENVAISRIQDADDREAVRRAAALAGADAFLSALPGGYDSLLGPSFVGGSDLSLGQWQRVALARAYFRDAPMLILDEPTASLDPRGEYEIFQQVRRLAEGHTVVLVSHRFSSVRAADRILVLDGGRIVEEGAHEELLARGGLYAELFEIQAQGYRGSTTS